MSESRASTVSGKLAVALAAAAFCLVAFGPGASAHVVLDPKAAPAGSWTAFQIRVPNESDTAGTVKVALRLPEGIASASYQPVPGWTARIRRSKLARPIETDDGPVTEEVSEVVWTASGKGVEPGQFQAFPMTVLLPDRQGEELAFKAVQTYSDGTVSRWIGSPDSMEPAPTVLLTAPVAQGSTTHSGKDGANPSGEGHGDLLAVIALVLAVIALVLAVGALVVVRRAARTAGR